MSKTRTNRMILYASLLFGVVLAAMALKREEPSGSGSVREPASAPFEQPREDSTAHAALNTPSPLSPAHTAQSSTGRRAVAGAIEVRASLGCSLGTYPTIVLSDERGTEVQRSLLFDLDTPTLWNDLDPGPYTIDLRESGWRTVHRSVEVHAASEPTVVSIPLQAESSVEGLVTDASTGQRISKFEVIVELRYHDPPTMAHTRPMMPTAFQGPSGEYCYAGVPAAGPSAPIDAIQVQVRSGGYAAFESEWIEFPGAGFFGRVDVGLEPLEAAVARLSGVVLEGPDEVPVAGALVGLVEAKGLVPNQLLSIGEETFGMPWTSRRAGSEVLEGVPSASDGSFELELRGSGRYQLVALRAGARLFVSDPMDLAPGARRESLRIVLDRGATLRGRLLLRDNRPEATTTGVRVLDLASQRERWAEVVDGAFELSGLEPGAHRATLFVDPQGGHVGPFSKAARPVSSVDATLAEGETTRVVLDAGGSSEVEGLEGVVRTPLDAPNLHFVAAILNPDAPAMPWAHTDVATDGTFSFEASPDTTCGIFAGGSDEEQNPSVVAMAFAELPAREQRSASPLHLDATGPVLEGHLPVGMQASRGARVRLQVQICTPSWAASLLDTRELTPDATGAFRFIGLPPGDYVLSVPGTSVVAHVHLDPGFHGTLLAELE